MSKIRHSVIVLLPGLVFLLFWEWMTHGNDNRLFFFSAPSRIAMTFLSDIQTIGLWQDIGYTAFAAFCGLLIGTVCGSALGITLWTSPRFAVISKPYIAILGAIPVFALAPMMIIWFGIGLWSKIMMAAFAVCLVACAQAYEGAQQTAKHHLLFARSLAASKLRIVRMIILPGALRWVMAGIRMNIGFALIGTFIAEFISSEHGLGHYILKAGGLYDMPRVFTGIILIAMVSVMGARLVKR